MSSAAAASMAQRSPDAYASLESSFQSSPHIRIHKLLPRSLFPSAQPVRLEPAASNDGTTSEDRTPLASPGASIGNDTGLPPTPPTNSQDDEASAVDGARSSMASRKSSLSTPVHQRSPPTPDPSPPRTNESMKMPVRPFIFAYPSSRAESFKTAREDQLSTDGSHSRADTPLAETHSPVNEDRGLGMAFERKENDSTPTNTLQTKAKHIGDIFKQEHASDRSGNDGSLRNVTVRKRRTEKPSPHKNIVSLDAGSPATRTRPPASESRRRTVSSQGSPQVQSIEAFANSIGWPTEPVNMEKDSASHTDTKRHSNTSMASTVVEAMVIVTPPKTRRNTLRHTGKNLAYRRDEDSSTERSSITHSNRTSINSDEIPPHRLIHKRASISDRKKRFSSASTVGTVRTGSPLSVHKYTMAHQESVRRVLQPAAESMSRANSQSRPFPSERGYHKRISSAPQPVRKSEATSTAFLERLAPQSPRTQHTSSKSPLRSETLPSTPLKEQPSPGLRKVRALVSQPAQKEIDVNKSLPHLPVPATVKVVMEQEPLAQESDQAHVAVPGVQKEPTIGEQQDLEQEGYSKSHALPSNTSNIVRRAALTSPGRSEVSRERTPTNRDSLLRPSLERIPTEELPRHSYESRSVHTDDPRRISFDRSTSRSEEHAMARHLFAANTPFSQFSDTPIEVSEATAVSIYPHNNHSLLVVQQVARSNSLPLEQLDQDDHRAKSPESGSVQLAPLVLTPGSNPDERTAPSQPTVIIEPSTPPMQISLPVPGAVDSPLKNPRAAPEPPVIKFIPPTPAEELERQLADNPPGPPARSDSHPQRRLSLVQRARRYSEDLISPFLARASSTRGRYVGDTHIHEKPRVPTVNDTDGALHPFWRPRGFWDGFDDSDDDDERLPQGGDTSDVEDPLEPEPNPKKLGVLGRRLTNGIKGSGGFLIGNSLGMERSGTNKRRPRIELPSQRPASPPMLVIQRPTLPLARVEKRGSQASMRSDRARQGGRRDGWRSGRKIPGVGLQVQYIGLSGVKERLRERKAEKRRDEIRKSIGSRYYVEDGPKVG